MRKKIPLLFWCIFPGLVSAQTTYYCLAYFKVPAARETQFLAEMRTTGARGECLYKVLSPSGGNTEYNYVRITTVRGFKNAFARSAGATQPVKEEVYAGLAFADSSSADPLRSKYAVVDFMQPKPDKFGEYIKMETDTFRIIHRERIRLGDISQWACLQLALPFDTKIGYSIVDFNFYNNLEDMLSSKYTEALKNTFPAADLGRLFRSAGAMRDNPKADLLQQVLFTP